MMDRIFLNNLKFFIGESLREDLLSILLGSFLVQSHEQTLIANISSCKKFWKKDIVSPPFYIILYIWCRALGVYFKYILYNFGIVILMHVT